MLEFALFLCFPAALALAAAMDLFTMTIPNRISLALIAGFAVAAPLSGLGPTAIAAHIAAGMLMFVVGALTWGFSRNEEHVRRFGTIVFGCAVAIGVVNLFNALAFQGAVL